MLKNIRIFVISFTLLSGILLSTEARAEEFNFTYILNTSGYADDIAPQLSVDVHSVDDTHVGFTFYNIGTMPSILTGVYFDDGALLGISQINDSDGTGLNVDFEKNNGGANLPQGNNLNPSFETEVNYYATNVDGVYRGVNADDPLSPPDPEWVEIVFELESGKSFADVLAAINLGFNFDPPDDPDLYDAYLADWTNNSLRIGLHIQSPNGISGLSDSFIMTPVPGAVILGLLGLGIVGIKLRKFA